MWGLLIFYKVLECALNDCVEPFDLGWLDAILDQEEPAWEPIVFMAGCVVAILFILKHASAWLAARQAIEAERALCMDNTEKKKKKKAKNMTNQERDSLDFFSDWVTQRVIIGVLIVVSACTILRIALFPRSTNAVYIPPLLLVFLPGIIYMLMQPEQQERSRESVETAAAKSS